MTRPPPHIDELVEHWTILDEERDLIAGKRGATRLAFGILLKFHTQYGRFREEAHGTAEVTVTGHNAGSRRLTPPPSHGGTEPAFWGRCAPRPSPSTCPMSNRLTKLAGGTAMIGLGAAAAMHVVWCFSPWPFANRVEAAKKIGGLTEAEMPSPAAATAATVPVALALGAAAYLVAAEAGLAPRLLPTRIGRLGTGIVSGVLLSRAGWGFVSSGTALEATSYTRLDLALYSPICLTLGALAAYVTKKPASR